MQDALLRAWRGLARFEGRSALRTWLYTIATNACLKAIERRPKLVLPIDYGPATDPHDGPARAARRIGVDRALPRRAPGPRRRRGRARGALRAARERRAGLHRGAAAPAGAPARRAHPARGARLLRPGGRRRARDDARLGLQRAAARPQERRRAAARAQPAGDAARAGRRRAARDRRRLRRRLGARRRRRAGRHARPTTPRSRCRRCRPGTAAATPSPPSWQRYPLAPGMRWRIVPGRRQRPAGLRLLPLARPTRGSFVAHSIVVLTLDGPRIADLTAFLTPEAFERFGLPAALDEPRGRSAFA